MAMSMSDITTSLERPEFSAIREVIRMNLASQTSISRKWWKSDLRSFMVSPDERQHRTTFAGSMQHG